MEVISITRSTDDRDRELRSKVCERGITASVGSVKVNVLGAEMQEQ